MELHDRTEVEFINTFVMLKGERYEKGFAKGK